MATFDKQAFATYLNKHISTKQFGEGKCAQHVRLALAVAGLKPITWPVPAKDWGGTLRALGFTAVTDAKYTPKIGDIVVIQATSKDKYGHIAGYDGKQWVSDFIQRDLWPGPHYREEKPDYALFRHP
jgi:surface antigen